MTGITFRKAVENDLTKIIELLSDDDLGKTRENFQIPLPKEYLDAFKVIDSNPDHELIVVEKEGSGVIGTLQLTFIPYLTYRGGIRAQIEAVRIGKNHRGTGLGKKMFEWAIERAKQRNAHLLQLTTDKRRPKSISFYENLGFKPTHVGMKMHLN